MSAPRNRRTATPAPRRRMLKAERKRQLLHHAKQLFAQLGYQHTTMDKIAAHRPWLGTRDGGGGGTNDPNPAPAG